MMSVIRYLFYYKKLKNGGAMGSSTHYKPFWLNQTACGIKDKRFDALEHDQITTDIDEVDCASCIKTKLFIKSINQYNIPLLYAAEKLVNSAKNFMYDCEDPSGLDGEEAIIQIANTLSNAALRISIEINKAKQKVRED